MQVTKKLKLTLATALAACCFGTAVAGIATVSNTALAADATTSWNFVGGGGKVNALIGASSGVNGVYYGSTVDILQQPGRTAYFSVYYNGDLDGWNALTLQNGNPGKMTAWNWTMPGEATYKDYPWHSYIFQDGTGQIYESARKYEDGHSVQGANYQKIGANFELHIGTGADGDVSYIKEVGKKNYMTWQNEQDLTVLDSVTTASFPDGCYLLVSATLKNDTSVRPSAVSDVGQIYGSGYTFSSSDVFNWEKDKFTKDAVMKLNAATADGFAEGYKLEVGVNGHALTADQYTVSVQEQVATVTVKKETLNGLNVSWYDTNTFISCRVLTKDSKPYGGAVMPCKMQFEDPPVLNTPADVVLTEKKPIEMKFTYTGETDLTADGVFTVASSLNNKLLEAENLEPGKDFTLKKGENGQYTVTITQAFVDEAFATHQTRAFSIRFGRHQLNSIYYLDVDTAEKGVRIHEGTDYVAGSLVQDDFYTSANIMKFAEASLSSRIFYEKPVPADQPITVEYGYIDPTVEWVMISFMNTNKISEYFSNEITTAQGNKLSQIFFGGDRHDFQKFDGWASDGSPTNVTFDIATKMKNNFVTVVLGEKAEDSYMEINGEKLSNKLSVKQSDFPDGVYVGLFYNNQKGSHYETVNTHLNPVTITAPQADNAYAMDLGAATDFEVTLATASTSGKLTITDDRGTTLPASDYSYDSASGKLTIKANYFTNRLFVKQGEIRIWDTEKKTGTAFKMAFSNVNLQPSKVAFTTPGSGDVTFDLGISGSVTGITTSDEPIADSAYTVNGGSVTIKAAAITVSSGIQEFIVQSAGKLYPCYVDVQNWADGIYKTGNGTVAKAGDGYKVTGAATYELEKIIDFTAGYSIGISFDKIGAYYENGLVVSKGGKYTGVQLKFYDPYTAYTLLVGLYANYSDDNISTANGALYIDYRISNAQGGVVATGRQASLQASKDHPSATGLQALQLKENNGGLQITAAGRDFNLTQDNLKGFNLAACILTVSAANATDDSVVTVTILDGTVDVYDKLSGGNTPGENPGGNTPGENPGGNTPGENPGDDEPTEQKKGCGSVIGSGIGVALAVLTAAAALVVVLRKKSTK